MSDERYPAAHVVADRPPFAMIPEALLYDASLTPSAVRVYGCLLRHGDDPENCYPSHARIAGLLGMSERSIARPLQELADAGWITKIKRPPREDGARRPDAYHVHLAPRSRTRPTAQTSAEPPRDPARTHRAESRGEREPGEREPGNETLLSDLAPSAPAVEDDHGFSAWWAAYPHKVSKPVARRAYDRAIRSGADPAALLAGLDRWARSWSGNATEQRFIPHPSTWLNQHRWQDDPPPVRQQAQGPRAPIASDRSAPSGRVMDL